MWLRDSWLRGGVWTAPMVVGCKFVDDQLPVAFIDRDQVVEALTASRADQPLAVGVRCRRSNGSLQNAEAKASQLGIQAGREDRIAVMDHKLVRMVKSEAIAELLEGPLGSGMRGYVGVQDPPRTNLHRDEDVQHAQRRGLRDECRARSEQ